MTYGIRKWLIEDRKIQYSKRDICGVYLKTVHSELSFRLSSEDFDKLDRQVLSDVNEFIHKKYIVQKRKFRHLKASFKLQKIYTNFYLSIGLMYSFHNR